MDTIPAEIDEFYSYTELQKLVDNRQAFHRDMDGGISLIGMDALDMTFVF